MQRKKRKKIKKIKVLTKLFNRKKILSEFLIGFSLLVIIFLVLFFVFSGNNDEGKRKSSPFLNFRKDEIQSSNEKIESDLIHPLGTVLYLGSFGYTSANIDSAKSDLYFDNVSSGIYFKPNIESENIDNVGMTYNQASNNLLEFSFSDAKKDRRCIGDNCLSFENEEMFYNGRSINLPRDIAASVAENNLAGISIAALDDSFLVGFTLTSGSNFKGRLFSFKSATFKEIELSEEIVSEDLALFGFGGISSDFIAIYGSSSAKAYHFQNGEVKDISKFFSFRPMAGGFKPEVIRVETQSGPNWYVFSSTKDKITFIKLWQNGGRDIVGESVLTDIINLRSSSAIFSLLEANDSEISFLLLEENLDKTKSWRKISDKGFVFSEGLIQTQEMPIYNGKKINIKNIVRSSLNVDEKYAPMSEYLISYDGNNFDKLPIGNSLELSVSLVDKYLLRVKLPRGDSVFESPYISLLAFDYSYERMD